MVVFCRSWADVLNWRGQTLQGAVVLWGQATAILGASGAQSCQTVAPGDLGHMSASLENSSMGVPHTTPADAGPGAEPGSMKCVPCRGIPRACICKPGIGNPVWGFPKLARGVLWVGARQPETQA